MVAHIAEHHVDVRGALVAAAVGLALDLLFFLVDELPATAPIALTLLILEVWERWRRRPSAMDALESAGAFRGDFKARLTGLTIALPPLRERREDLGLIVGALLRRLSPAPD